jgi:hypothetical protein
LRELQYNPYLEERKLPMSGSPLVEDPSRLWAIRFIRVLAILCLFAAAFRFPEASHGQNIGRTYKHDAKGLQKQFGTALKAVPTGGQDQLKASFGDFALPHPDVWFGEYFPKDQIQQLVWDNEAELDTYRNSLVMMLRRFLPPPYWVRCKLETHTSTTLKPKADGIQPTTPIPIEQYTIMFTGANGRSMTQLVNFVYVDGAFRYLGKGAYPFWSMPDESHKP